MLQVPTLVVIKANTPCEIQIRTLEQHAYAEISHDYVYKSGREVDRCILILLEKHKISGEDIELFIPEYIIENVVQRQDIMLFKQPIIFAIYYLVKYYTREFQEIWEFPEDTLDLIYSDLGMSNDY